jgi:hypothetical protein
MRISILLVIHASVNRKGNHEMTLQRHCQYWAHKIQDENKQSTKTQHTTKAKNMGNTDPTKNRG